MKELVKKMENKVNTKSLEDYLPIISTLIFVIICLFIIFSANKSNSNLDTQKIPNTKITTKNDCYIVPAPEPWDCTGNCSGHQAGYDWAKRKNISNPLLCTGNSNSFIAGCEYYFQEKEHNESLMECGALENRYDGFEYNQYE